MTSKAPEMSHRKRWLILGRSIEILSKDKFAFFGVVVIIIFAIVAILAPQIARYQPDEIVRDENGNVPFLQPPSKAYPFGTTNIGRDVFSQVVYGTRTAFLIGILTAVTMTFVGTTLGITAGFYKKWLGELLMRMVDIAYSIPLEPFLIVFISFSRPNIWTIILAINLIMWRSSARVIRAETLSISQETYIEAARAIGASGVRILFVHILPHVLSLSMVYIAIGVGWAVLAEANISFLGYGAAGVVSWGKILQMAYVTGGMRRAWWWAFFPGFVIMLLVVSVFFISRAYEREFNPKAKEAS